MTDHGCAVTEDDARWQIPFYEACGLFKDVEMIDYEHICDFREQHTSKLLHSKQFYDLDLHRAFPIDFEKIDKREWQYAILSKHYEKNFSICPFPARLQQDKRADGKVIVSIGSTEDFAHEEAFPASLQHDIIFTGTEAQWKAFVSEVGYDVEFIEARDMLTAAELISGAKGVIGDGIIYALAEMLKLPRLKIGSDSTLPIGGHYYDIVHSGATYADKVEQIMKRG